MNILTFLFLPAVIYGDSLCPQYATDSVEIQPVAANRQGLSRDGHRLAVTGAISAVQTNPDGDAKEVARSGSDDLLFYLSSHAQALGDTSAPTMTPWLELRPIGAFNQDAMAVTGGTAPAFDEHACERSAAHVPAPDAASRSDDVTG